MPKPKGTEAIWLRVDTVPKLRQKWKKQREKNPDTNDKFGGYVNDLLEDILRKDAFLEIFAPALSLDGYSGNVLYIKDAKRNATAEIYRYGNHIKCALDDSFSCEHVYFALAIPEVAKLNIKQPPPSG